MPNIHEKIVALEKENNRLIDRIISIENSVSNIKGSPIIQGYVGQSLTLNKSLNVIEVLKRIDEARDAAVSTSNTYVTNILPYGSLSTDIVLKYNGSQVVDSSMTDDGSTVAINSDIDIDGSVEINTCADAGTDTNKILVLDSGNIVDHRTGAELLDDLSGDAAAAFNWNAQDLNSIATLTADNIRATSTVAPSAADGASLGTTSLEFSDLYLADSGVISLGNDQDVTLTHLPDTGILLNTTMQFQFRDAQLYIASLDDGHIDIEADTQIDLNSSVYVKTVADAGADVNKIVVLDAGNILDYRTGAELLSDLSGDAAGAFDWNAQNLTNCGNIEINSDADKIYFGAGQDSSISYNGTNFVFDSQEVGTGHFLFDNGNIGINSVANNRMLNLDNSALSLTQDEYGIWVQLKKTAGASTIAHDIYGIRCFAEMDHNGATMGNIIALQGNAYLRDGTMGQSGSNRYLMGFNFAAESFVGSTLWGYMQGVRLAVRNRGTLNGDMSGLHLILSDTGTLTGTSYAIYIDDTSIDYGIYQVGSATNSFVGKIQIVHDGRGLELGAGNDVRIHFNGSDLLINSLNVTANDEVHFTNFDFYVFDNPLKITTIKSGATQAAAGAAANEIWVTNGHATQEDNTLMIGV